MRSVRVVPASAAGERHHGINARGPCTAASARKLAMKNRTHSWLRFAQGFWLLVTPLLNAADVSSYSISKGIYFEQTGAGIPTALTNNGYAFDARVDLTQAGFASGAQVLTPASGNQVLTSDGDTLEFKKKYNTSGKLDSNYPAGSYSLSINTAHEGTRTVTLEL